MHRRLLPLLLFPVVACQGPNGSDTDDGVVDTTDTTPDDSDAPSCDYPAGATEPMTLNEVLWPYRWPEALDAARNLVDLDLGLVPCAADPDIDWSPFDVLLFVSIPAW